MGVLGIYVYKYYNSDLKKPFLLHQCLRRTGGHNTEYLKSRKESSKNVRMRST